MVTRRLAADSISHSGTAVSRGRGFRLVAGRQAAEAPVSKNLVSPRKD